MSAQAISVSVSAGRSVWRALLWKEWRQQRWVALPLAALPTVVFMAFFLLLSIERHEEGTAIAVAVGVSLLLPLILGASVFCGEKDDATDEFLRQMPSGGLRVFCLKLLSVWGATGLMLLMLGATIALAIGTMRAEIWMEFLNMSVQKISDVFIILYVSSLLFLGILPALISAWVKRTLPNILTTVLAATILFVCLKAMISVLARYAPAEGMKIVLALGLYLFPIVLAAPWLWIRSRTGMSVRVGFATGICLLALQYVMIFATPFGVEAAKLYSASPENGLFGLYPSPNGKYVTSTFPGPRQILIDAETGRYNWLSRFRVCYGPSMSSFWSPSGKRFFWRSGRMMRPDFPHVLIRPRPHGEGKWWIAETDAERNTPVDDFSPELARLFREGYFPAGWLGEQHVVLKGNKKVAFLDISKGQAQAFTLPEDIANKMWVTPEITRDGLIVAHAAWQDGDEPRVNYFKGYRFAPEMLAPEPLFIPIPNERGPVYLDDVSHDGHWALVRVSSGTRVVPLVSEEPQTALEPVPEDEKNRNLLCAGFLGESNKVLFAEGKELIVHDPDLNESKIITLTLSQVRGVFHINASATGRYCAAHVFGKNALGQEKGFIVVTDLVSGEMQEIDIKMPREVQWLGDDWLLWQRGISDVLLIKRDGTQIKPLIKT